VLDWVEFSEFICSLGAGVRKRNMVIERDIKSVLEYGQGLS